MKKTYFIPKSTLLSLNSEEMIALSGEITEINPEEGDGEDTRRQGSLWDSWND